MKILLITILFLTGINSFSQDYSLKENFMKPPLTSHPGVYWYFMDGNLSREEMTKDLESMREAGISNLIFLEVGIGVPRGSVDFMSEEWQEMFVHAVREAERLGIKILLGAGPGWCGSGGPWVKAEESMKHLVFSETDIKGGDMVEIDLPVPEQRSTVWHTMKDPYYEDKYVFAVPGSAKAVIKDINEKALYERDPISSKPNVKPLLPSLLSYDEGEAGLIPSKHDIIDISNYLEPGGKLKWDAPPGDWTIVRMGLRVTGASTRPSPEPVIGLECDKLNANAFANHLKNYTDILLEKTSPRKEGAGWTGFHMDSWESGAQNWTEGIVEEFQNRRGYDPLPFFTTFSGRGVESLEISERFLWDYRKTCQELLLENHAGFARDYAHKNGLELTIEPYDMNPAGDLDLGSYADVIMAEFWSEKFGYPTAYAVIEATSISHISGRPVVGAEVFTADGRETWQQYPWSMKSQSDWALAMGVNRFVYHTFAHKPLGDEYRPGMTMGPYGVHWDRGQTWWPMVDAYHEYISRCSHMMQQGQAVSDILYLAPEGAPMVFKAPEDALEANGTIPDKKGYGFDGCSPEIFIEKAEVKDGRISFPGASSYQIMVLPSFRTMTPRLLKKIITLVDAGARVIGTPPLKSPGLSGYPQCDQEVRELSKKLWGMLDPPGGRSSVKYGKGVIYWGGELSVEYSDSTLYPSYASTVAILRELDLKEDFRSENNSIRYGHRRSDDKDIYFIANRTDKVQKTECMFRAEGVVDLWIGRSGETREITEYTVNDGITTIPMEFYPYESFFIVFSHNGNTKSAEIAVSGNFPEQLDYKSVKGLWDVSFDTNMGGPENIVFKELHDWTKDELRGIKYYSGIATYRKVIEIENIEEGRYFLDLGEVHDIARVILNGRDMGVAWCSPWQVEISNAIKKGSNKLEIQVANRWINRLLGDKQEPDANVRTVKFDNGLLGGQEFRTGRYTFTLPQALGSFRFTEPLESGLLGPVRVVRMGW